MRFTESDEDEVVLKLDKRHQHKRISEHCQKIWGPSKEYDLKLVTRGRRNQGICQLVVREEKTLHFGSPLLLTCECKGEEGAMDELDRMLGLLVANKESGKLLTEEEKIEIFGGRNGENKDMMHLFYDYKALVAALNQTKTEGGKKT